MTETHWKLLINKQDIRKTLLQNDSESRPALNAGEIEVKVTHFALTSNNVTYALLGSSFGMISEGEGYWSFFPSGATDSGLLPVWGFGEIMASRCEGLAVGEEIYGYLPLASHWIMRPERLGATTFVDVAAHRTKLPSAYNQYRRISKMPEFDVSHKDFWSVFQPLLITGYMISDQFADADDYGAAQIIVASASSKTALMFAHCLRARETRPRLIGLTSPSNIDFVRQTGLYDDVLSYNDIAKLDPEIPSALVDMAGNSDLIELLYTHMNNNMRFGLLVGRSHWNSELAGDVLKARGVKMFFAPGRMKKRATDWGADGLNARLQATWLAFMADAGRLTKISRHHGAEAARDLYAATVAGQTDARLSSIIVLS